MYFKYLMCCCSKQQEADESPPPPDPACVRSSKSAEHSHLGLLDQGNSGVQASVSIEEGSVNTGNQIAIERSTDSVVPRLEIKVIEGAMLHSGHTFKINSTGLEGSIRGANDCEVYFGSAAKIKDEVVNDFVLPPEEGVGNRHFLIKYSPADRKYFLRDLGDGSGTFVKITTKFRLSENYILSFGENHMIVQGCGIPGTDNARLTVKFIDGPKIDKVYHFNPQDSPVRIGRQADCQLRFEDNSLSRYQSIMTYQEGEGWFVQDGDGKKHSTNGTWVYVDFSCEIYDHMIFKAGQSLFETSLL